MSKVIVKFHGGHFLLDNAPWSGRSVEVDRDQTETLIENNQYYTMQDSDDILKISKSMKLLKMKRCLLFYGKENTQTFGQCNI